LQPLGSAERSRKQVTIVEKDGMTPVRPGTDAPVDQVLFIDDSGAAVGAPPDTAHTVEADNGNAKAAMPPRVGTPARPRSRRGDVDDEQSPRPHTPATQVPGTPRPTRKAQRLPGTPRPGSKGLHNDTLTSSATLDACDDSVKIGSPGRTGRALAAEMSSDTSSSDEEAEAVEMACDSPLGNTGAAKELCNVAIAAAVGMAFGSDAHNQDAKSSAAANAEPAPEAKSGAKCQALDKCEAAPLKNTANFGNTLNNTGVLGNTATAMMLCDDAIAAAVGAAVDGLNLNGTCGTVDDVVSGGTMMMTLGSAGGTMRATKGASMAGTLGMTLGATGDVPPIEPGEDLPGDVSLPTTPQKETAQMLREALASDDDEDDEDREALSPTLMSICSPGSPAPSKRDLNASLGDSPSIILLDDTHWTPCKPLSRPLSPSPCSPRPPSSRRKGERKQRPVRCGSPEALSARGRKRHEQEMAALGTVHMSSVLPSARGSRPRGRGVRHFAVAGGA